MNKQGASLPLQRTAMRCKSAVFRIVFMVFGILIGCSGKYMYIPPVSNVYIPLEVNAERDLIPYCNLSVAHFKADEPPAAYLSIKERIGAASTIIVYAPYLIIDPMEVLSNPDSARWEASLDYLRWEARFVTKASWWNPNTKGDAIKQALEHEQAHFAITEREARKENALSAETGESIRVTGPTQEAVIAKMMKRIETRRKRVLERVQAWNAKYDLETKNGLDSEAQQEWEQRLLKQLEELD